MPTTSTANATATGRTTTRDEKTPQTADTAGVNAAPVADKWMPVQQPVVVMPVQARTDGQTSEPQTDRTADAGVNPVNGPNTEVHSPTPAPVVTTTAEPQVAAPNGAPANAPTASRDADVADKPASATTAQAPPALPQDLVAPAEIPANLLLPEFGLSSSDGAVAQSSSAVTGKPGQNPVPSKTADTGIVAAPGKTYAVNGAAPSSGAHGTDSTVVTANSSATQTASPAAQHSADATQVAAKPADSAATALQAIGASSATHDVSPRRLGDIAGDGPRSNELTGAIAATPRENGESTPTSAINTAKLIQTVNETGMQVGMRSAEFGDISIRTSVSQQQMLAQISVDHGDLGRAIAMHVPAVQSKLGEEFGLHATIQVHQSGASFSGEQGNASSGQQKSYGRPLPVDSIAAEAETSGSIAAAAAWDGNRLDVRA